MTSPLLLPFGSKSERQKLHDRQIDRRVETQSSLVRADGGTVLNPVATIHLNFAMVIDPGHAENDDALRYEQALKQVIFGINGILLDIGP